VVSPSAHAIEVGDLRITEVLAANATVLADESGEFDDWIELANRTSSYIDLGGLFLSDDEALPQKWEIPPVVIGPGEFLLVWADDDGSQGDFHANFKLNAQGEQVMLYDSVAAGNGLLDRISYGLQSQDVAFGLLAGGAQQVPDYLTPATPNASNSGASLFSDVCINEFLTTSSGGGVDDWVELYNRGTASVDLSGWGVSDNRALPMKYVIPPGVSLDAGSYLFLDETVLGFSFSSLGEEIHITGSDGVTGYDFREFGPQLPDITSGRYVDGDTRWFSLSPTPGATNASPTIGVEVSSSVVSAAPVVNPVRFGAATTFTLSRRERIEVSVFDAGGRRVRRVYAGTRAAGTHTIAWDGASESGATAASGRYWMVIEDLAGATSVPITVVR
jgi:hypothetical protein